MRLFVRLVVVPFLPSFSLPSARNWLEGDRIGFEGSTVFAHQAGGVG